MDSYLPDIARLVALTNCFPSIISIIDNYDDLTVLLSVTKISSIISLQVVV